MFSAQFLLLPLLLASYVSAHGILTRAVINGQTYNNRGGNHAIRTVNSQDPLYGAFNPGINCGVGAAPAPEVANVNAGDSIEFHWRSPNNDNWPHNTGPMLTYMASCGDRPCTEFNSGNARWFKVDQVGKYNDGGAWVQQELMSGAPARTKIPANLAPGNYLIRHEIIALHLAQRHSGAEFYAGCLQVRVNNGGSGFPAENELVSIPGAYYDEHPGILTPNPYGGGYEFPGPAIARLAGSAPAGNGNNGNNGNNTPAPASSSTSTSPAPTSNGNNNGNSGNTGSSGTGTAAPAKTTKICRLRKTNKRAVALSARAPEGVSSYPRHVGRAMRRLAKDAFDLTH